MLEENIVESFRLAKSDIIKIQHTINQLNENQERLMDWMRDTREKEIKLYEQVKELKRASPRSVSKVFSSKRSFVASKTGKKVHEKNCPFAKNIKPKMQVIFKTKKSALNKGYKACECLKRI